MLNIYSKKAAFFCKVHMNYFSNTIRRIKVGNCNSTIFKHKLSNFLISQNLLLHYIIIIKICNKMVLILKLWITDTKIHSFINSLFINYLIKFSLSYTYIKWQRLNNYINKLLLLINKLKQIKSNIYYLIYTILF